jgi:hypothetical protein
LAKIQETSSTGGLSFSWEIASTEVKGWVTKIQFQRGRLTKKTDVSSTIPPDSPLGMILKGFFDSAL